MKKLRLSELNLGNAEVLTREQLKKVLGGNGSGGGSGGDYRCVSADGHTCAGSCVIYGGPCAGMDGTCAIYGGSICGCTGGC